MNFLSLCFREFAKEKARAQKSGEFQKLREKRIIDNAYDGYFNWIQQAGVCYVHDITAVHLQLLFAKRRERRNERQLVFFIFLHWEFPDHSKTFLVVSFKLTLLTIHTEFVSVQVFIVLSLQAEDVTIINHSFSQFKVTRERGRGWAGWGGGGYN